MAAFLKLKYRADAVPGKAPKKTPKTAIEVREAKKIYDREKRTRKFQIEWTSERPWLTFDVSENKMFCDWCRKPNDERGDSKLSDLAFVKGTDNFKLDAIRQHETSKWHTYFVPKNCDQETPAEKCVKTLRQSEYDKLQVKFRTAHAIAKHQKSFLDYSFICALDKAKGLEIGDTYTNDKAIREFVRVIAEVERQKVKQKLVMSDFFSFTCDGSTDFTGEELDNFYIRVVIDLKVEDCFLHIGSPESACSQDIFDHFCMLFRNLELLPILKTKLVGFCADGASNMQGRKNGLAAKLLELSPEMIVTHCVAHRLELSFKDAIKASYQKLYDKAMTLLLGIFYFYRKSPKQKKALKRSFESLGMKQVLPLRIGGTRWLPHMERALYSFFRSYRAIRLQLENASHDCPKAEGFAKLICDGNLLTFLLVLKEIISVLMKLSLYLQKRELSLSDAYLRVDATKTCLQTASLDLQSAEEVVQNKEFQNQSVTFNGIVTQPKVVAERLCEKLVKSFGDRFPISPVLEATFISNLKNWPLPGSDAIKEFGQNEVAVLVNQFKGLLVESGRDPKEIPAEWVCLKTTVYKRFSSRLTSRTLKWEDLHSCGEDLPNIFGLISLVRALPPTSVRNEATFSTMKLTKGKRRARLNNETLDDLLMINLESSSVDQYNPQEAITKWMNTKGKRRLHYKRAPIQVGTSDTQMMETSDFLNRAQPDTDTQMDTTDSLQEPDSQTSDLSDLVSELVADPEDNADEDLDYDSDSDVEQTERENDVLLNMIIEYEYELE